MGMLMMKCPRTSKYFALGISIDAESFKTSHFEGNQSQCPHCGEMHTWGMEEVRLLEEIEGGE